jgi:hypothetical protein
MLMKFENFPHFLLISPTVPSIPPSFSCVLSIFPFNCPCLLNFTSISLISKISTLPYKQFFLIFPTFSLHSTQFPIISLSFPLPLPVFPFFCHNCPYFPTVSLYYPYVSIISLTFLLMFPSISLFFEKKDKCYQRPVVLALVLLYCK